MKGKCFCAKNVTKQSNCIEVRVCEHKNRVKLHYTVTFQMFHSVVTFHEK